MASASLSRFWSVSLCHPSFLIIKKLFSHFFFLFFDTLPSSFQCLPPLPGAGLPSFSLFFSLFPSVLPSSLFHLYHLSLPLFISASLPRTPAVDSRRTQRDLSPFTTRHHWHNLLTATLNYFCTLPACRSPLACQTALIRAPEEEKKQPPFLDAHQGGALDRLLLAHG